MIRFHLTCDQDHQFDSWFQSGAAFEALQKSGLLTCTTCGSAKVSKTLMAPNVQVTDATKAPKPTAPDVAKIKKHVEQNADYVGPAFAAEARAIHDGDKPDRAIYGEANGIEARKLIADGVPVLPLPFVPTKKAH